MGRETLLKMPWKNFSTYPLQMSSIYIHCHGKDTESGNTLHKFVKIETFKVKKGDRLFVPLNVNGGFAMVLMPKP